VLTEHTGFVGPISIWLFSVSQLSCWHRPCV